MNEVVDFPTVTQEQMQTDLRAVFQGAIRASLEILLEEEVKALCGANRYERAAGRRGHRNGSYLRGLLTSMGHIEVKVPRTREGSSAEVLGAYQRRTNDVDAMMTEAYVNGVSQRKMGEVTEQLMGQRVSKSTVSRVAKRLAQTVEALQRAPLEQAFAYVYLDATFVDARWARSVDNVSALVAYGVGQDGFRHLLGVHIGPQESEASWSELLEHLTDKGLVGVRLVISDEHAGLAKAVRTWLPEAERQRCTVHLQRNVLSKTPRRLGHRIAREVSAIFQAHTKAEATERLQDFCATWQTELPEAVSCLQHGFEGSTRFYAFPQAHHKRIRTANPVERLHREIKRRTKAVGAFPDRQSALRLITAVAIQTCAKWGDRRYLNMDLLEPKEMNTAA